MAIRRGFRNIDEFKIIQDEWNKYITNIQQDLYETLAEIMLNEPIGKLTRILKKDSDFSTTKRMVDGRRTPVYT